jgi:hypothetical protein
MQGLKSLFRRPQVSTLVQPKVASAPVLLSPQDLKHVAGGLPHVPTTNSVVASDAVSPLPHVG